MYFVDGIIAGEKEGPLEPSNKRLGLIAVGDHPLLIDTVYTTLIGFDYKKIPSLINGLKYNILNLNETNFSIGFMSKNLISF